MSGGDRLIQYPAKVEPNPAAYAAPAVPDMPTWFRQASEPRRFRKRLVPTGDSRLQLQPTQQPETVFVSAWWRQASEPVRFRKRAASLRHGVSVLQLEPTQQPEQVTPAFWWRQPSEPVRFRPRDEATYEAPFTYQHDGVPDPIIATLGALWVSMERQRRFRRVPVRTGLIALQVDPLLLLIPEYVPQLGGTWPDQFRLRLFDPAVYDEPLTFQGENQDVAAPLDPGAGLYAWWMQASEPIRFVPEAQDMGGLDFQASEWDEVVLLPSYWVQHPGGRPRPIEPAVYDDPLTYTHDGSSDPAVGVIDWWQQPTEPVRSRPQPVAEGWDVLGIPDEFTLETIYLSSHWVQYPGGRPRPREDAALEPALTWQHDGVEDAVAAVVMDMWWRPASEPRRYRPNRRWVYPAVVSHYLSDIFTVTVLPYHSNRLRLGTGVVHNIPSPATGRATSPQPGGSGRSSATRPGQGRSTSQRQGGSGTSKAHPSPSSGST